MVIRVNYHNLDIDDEGRFDELHPHHKDARYPDIQNLLLDWLPSSEDGGYQGFIDKYHLDQTLTPQQIETLYTQTDACMGNRLAGIVSVLAPPELCCWKQVRNIHNRALTKPGPEVEISQDAANSYLTTMTETLDLSFKELLRLYRRAALLSQDELAQKMGITRPTIASYERGDNYPGNYEVHAICDALELGSKERLRFLDAAGIGALEKLESDDSKTRHEGKKSLIGGGTLFGALLYHLRKSRGWTQQNLADRTGMDRRTISGYEHKVLPKIDNANRIIDALGVEDGTRHLLLTTAGKGTDLSIVTPKPEKPKRPEIIRPAIGELIVQLRTQKEWSQAELKKRSGVSVVDYELGNSSPDVTKVHKLCNALNTDRDTRFLMLELAAQKAVNKLPEGSIKREKRTLAGCIGGGSTFGALIYNLRTQKGWTQEELATRCGLDKQKISSYEKGEHTTDNKNVIRICDALEVEEHVKKLVMYAAQHFADTHRTR